jgi:lysophospholipase L1-like esterase
MGAAHIDCYDVSLGPDGKPLPVFVADQLHFNAEGYKLLAQRVPPYLPVVTK